MNVENADCYKSTHRIKFSDLDPYNHMRTAVYAAYYVDHRMNGLHEHVGWNLKTLAKLPFMVWVRRMEVDFLRTVVGDQEINIMSFVREFRGPDAHIECRVLIEQTVTAYGRLVAVSSLADKNGIPTRSGYAASKHAMAGFFDSLRIELADAGVSVTVIYPGFVTSETRTRAFGTDGQPFQNSPVRESEVMTPQECAHLIIKAMAKRKREEVMTLRGELGLWLKLISPTTVDRVARRAIESGR